MDQQSAWKKPSPHRRGDNVSGVSWRGQIPDKGVTFQLSITSVHELVTPQIRVYRIQDVSLGTLFMGRVCYIKHTL